MAAQLACMEMNKQRTMSYCTQMSNLFDRGLHFALVIWVKNATFQMVAKCLGILRRHPVTGDWTHRLRAAH